MVSSGGARGQGGIVRAPLAPLPEGMAPLGHLVRRSSAGGAAFCRSVKYATVAPQENFHAPLGRNPGSATDRDGVTQFAPVRPGDNSSKTE
jgi:hypothetical protein